MTEGLPIDITPPDPDLDPSAKKPPREEPASFIVHMKDDGIYEVTANFVSFEPSWAIFFQETPRPGVDARGNPLVNRKFVTSFNKDEILNVTVTKNIKDVQWSR